MMTDDAALDRYMDDQHQIFMRRAALEAEVKDMEAAAGQRYRNGGKDLRPAPQLKPLRAGVSGMRLPPAAMKGRP
jgi:hypothetical protein